MVLQEDASGYGLGESSRLSEAGGGGADSPSGIRDADRAGDAEPVRRPGAADRFPHSLCDSVHLPLHFQPEGSEGAECRQSPGTASNLLAALRQVQLFV